MLTTLLGSTGAGGIITGLAYIGCVTALAVTGHISGSDALVAFGIIGGGATAVTAAHVSGTAVGQALQTPPPQPVAVAEPKPTVTV